MMIVLSALAVAFGAFCIWLTVRIVNRREGWAKWTLTMLVGLPVLYVASFGPACWISSWADETTHTLSIMYRPLLRVISRERFREAIDEHQFELAENTDMRVTLTGGLRNGFLTRYAELFATSNAQWVYSIELWILPGEAVKITNEEWKWRRR